MQMTWRASDDLMERVRRVAEREGRSMNEYVTRVLDAATNPDYAGGDMARLRERLARAGVLAAPGAPRVRPDPEELAAAAAEAATGTTLADLIDEGRGPR